MPEYDDVLEPDDEGELQWVSPEPEAELPDAGTVAFLDQQEAEFMQNREKWVALYGFDHDCHCSQDYTDGKMGTVTQCFMELMSQALARCAEATHENRVYSAMLTEMLAVNNDLVKLMEDHGLEKELQAYFGETLELEDDILSELDLLGLEDEEPTDEQLQAIEDEQEDAS